MEEKIKDELRDDMLSNMIQQTGYDASTDFTERIMGKVNPPVQENTFIPKEWSLNWLQLSGLVAPFIIVFIAIGYAFAKGNANLTSTFTEVFSSQAFYISLAVGFSTILYFSINQYIFHKK